MLSLDDGMNCIIHKRAEKVIAGGNEPIEPPMPDESSIAEPEQCPIWESRVRQEGENDTRLSKAKQNKIRKHVFGREDKESGYTAAPISGPPNS